MSSTEMMTLARQFPRDWKRIGDQLLAACAEAEFARYAASPTFLTATFAEHAASLLANTTIETTPEISGGVPFYRTTLTDLETNRSSSEVFPDLKIASLVQRRLVIAFLPSVLRTQCFEACKATMAQVTTKHWEPETKLVLSHLRAEGVELSDIKEFLGHPYTAVTPPELENLRGVVALLREGLSTWAQLLEHKRGAKAGGRPPAAPAKEAAAKPKAPRKAKTATAKPAAATPPAPEAPRPNRRATEETFSIDPPDLKATEVTEGLRATTAPS